MPHQFYYQVMGEVIGPMTGVKLRDNALEGHVESDTPVRVDEHGEWVLAGELNNLFDRAGRAITHEEVAKQTKRASPPSPLPSEVRQPTANTTTMFERGEEVVPLLVETLIGQAVPSNCC